MARFSVATGELQESIGYGLLPVIEAIIPVMLKMAEFASENVTVIKILVGVVAGLAAGILVANVALKAFEAVQILVKAATVAWTAVQWLLNAALTANPIGIVTVAVAALVAGIVIAYNKSETFRDIVQAALAAVRVAVDKLVDTFKALWDMAQSAFDWIVGHWKLALFAFGPIGAAVYLLVSKFDAVLGAAQKVAGFVSGAFEAAFSFGPVEAAIAGITGAFNAIYGAIQSVIGAVESLIGALGRIHVPSINLPHIPNPFAVAPAPIPSSSMGRRAAPTSTAAGGVTINVYGAVDPEGTARAIKRILAGHDRRQGWAPA
jgi:hypothetical protein